MGFLVDAIVMIGGAICVVSLIYGAYLSVAAGWASAKEVEPGSNQPDHAAGSARADEIDLAAKRPEEAGIVENIEVVRRRPAGDFRSRRRAA